MMAIDYIGLVAVIGIYVYCIWIVCQIMGFGRRDEDDDPPDPY